MMSSSDEKELQAALSCKRKRRRWWKHEINEKRERLGEYHRLCVELQSHEDFRTFPINFTVNSSAITYCPPGKFVSKTQMSAARLLFDGDNVILRNTIRTTSRRDNPLSVWPMDQSVAETLTFYHAYHGTTVRCVVNVSCCDVLSNHRSSTILLYSP